MDRRAPRELPPHPVHAPVAARRLAILRALLVGDDAAQHPGIHPRGDSAAHLFAQSRSRSDRARPVHRLPAIPPGQLQGPCIGAQSAEEYRQLLDMAVSVLKRRPAPRARLPRRGDAPRGRGVAVRDGAALQIAARCIGELFGPFGHRQRPHRRRRRLLARRGRRCRLLQLPAHPQRFDHGRLDRAAHAGRRYRPRANADAGHSARRRADRRRRTGARSDRPLPAVGNDALRRGDLHRTQAGRKTRPAGFLRGAAPASTAPSSSKTWRSRIPNAIPNG